MQSLTVLVIEYIFFSLFSQISITCLFFFSEKKPTRFIMDFMILRFLHIAEGVFEQLDNKSVKNCGEVAKVWQKCIDKKKLSWIQIVSMPRILKKEDTYFYVAAKSRQLNLYFFNINK